MRMIVILAAASITFATTLPAFAQTKTTTKSCAASESKLGNKAFDLCIAAAGSENFFAVTQMFDKRMFMGDAAYRAHLIADWNSAKDNPNIPQDVKDCGLALLRWVDACVAPKYGGWVRSNYKTPPKYGGQEVSRYKPPHAPVTPRDPKQMPPAGLLETTPGFSPQGPAAGGTLSRPSGSPNAGAPSK
jgi:hypothetical protein